MFVGVVSHFPMCDYEQEVIYSFPTGVSVSSYPCSLGHMGSTSHLANELGKVVRDHSTTDGRIMYCRTPYV